MRYTKYMVKNTHRSNANEMNTENRQYRGYRYSLRQMFGEWVPVVHERSGDHFGISWTSRTDAQKYAQIMIDEKVAAR